jgi:hypothetical protein
MVGSDRFDYPENHIEADNRLSWVLGELDKRFGDRAFYVHLKRDSFTTAKSFLSRYFQRQSIMEAYAEGVKMTPPEKLNKQERLKLSQEMVDVVNSNIEHFLKDKTNKMTIELENVKVGFSEFWDKLEATGNKKEALAQFDIRSNSSETARSNYFLYEFKLLVLRLWRRLSNS